jgi:hypothetical protein
MKLGALLLALSLLLALPDVAGWLRRRLVPRARPAAPRRRVEARVESQVASRFERVEKTRPLDPGHYYKRYWS